MADSKPPCVPLVEQLDKIYQDVNGSLKEVHEKRFYNLMKRFEALYGEKPKFFCRAPGRVNIIGEHIDYCGYSVLPAALDQDFIMAYIPSGDDKITINNVDKDLYPTETLTTEPHQKFREQAHFINYFLCGYKAVLALSDSPFKETVKEPKGFKMLCESLVPPAAGLSSSSAFCVCAAVTTLHANGLLDKIDQATLAELVIQAERMAGTACGGMDQTISLMGKMNTAKLIDFVPTLKATDVEIPPSVSLVIANSLTPSPKLATLGTRYNKRVVECRFGVAIMALKKGLCKDYMDCKYTTFQQLQEELKLSFLDMEKEVSKCLKSGGYTVDMIKNHTGYDGCPFDLVAQIPHVDQVMEKNTAYYLFERAQHVFGEARRVHEFKALCDDKSIAEDEKIKQLGELMNASHKSCDMLYDCSSPELNELTTMATKAGALGSRLTGAGWGGCCVSLVKRSDLAEFVPKLMDYFTKERPMGDQLWVTEDLERYIFATNPGQGACVLDPTYCDFFI